MKPKLISGMETDIKAAVQAKGGRGSGRPISFLLAQVGKVTEAGNTAYVTYAIDGGRIRLTLKDRGDYWEVAGMDGFAQALSSVGTSAWAKGNASLKGIKVLTDRQVVGAFKRAGIPLGKVIYYAEATDSNKLLGRPGQYVQKASWADSRIEQYDPTDPTGGTVEVFDSTDSMQNQWDYLSGFVSSGGFFAQYMYKGANVIVRVEHDLTPKQAKQYVHAEVSLGISGRRIEDQLWQFGGGRKP